MKLFISYRRKTWPFTHRLADDLRQIIDGEIFVDFSGIDEADFERSILKNLRESDAMLLVVSPETFAADRIHRDDDWVRREIALALELDKPVVLVCVDGLLPPPPADLPENILDITRMQGINFYPDYWEAAVQRLAEFVAKVTLAEPAAAPAPMTAAQPLASNATLQKAIGLLEAGNYDKAIFLLTELKAAGFRPKFLDVEAVLGEAIRHREAEQRQREAQEGYEAIRVLAGSRITLDQARVAWDQFRTQYPNFEDSADLAEKLKPIMPPEDRARKDAAQQARPLQSAREQQKRPPRGKAKPLQATSEQQALLDVMPDTKCPLQERAEAGRKLAELGDPRPGVCDLNIQWCDIPAGEFIYQGKQNLPFLESLTRVVRQGKFTFQDYQKPTLPAFRISKYPITYAQYKMFLEAPNGRANMQWWKGLAQQGGKPSEQHFKYANHPAENISWYDAVAFCRWLSVKLGYTVALPTEEQWEKAARGTDGRVYPYGNRFDAAKGNAHETKIKQTSAVGIFWNGASPYGVLDMSGNVWQWTLTEYDSRKSSDMANSLRRVLRGGSFGDGEMDVRCTCRAYGRPVGRSFYRGFRVVCKAAPAR